MAVITGALLVTWHGMANGQRACALRAARCARQTPVPSWTPNPQAAGPGQAGFELKGRAKATQETAPPPPDQRRVQLVGRIQLQLRFLGGACSQCICIWVGRCF